MNDYWNNEALFDENGCLTEEGLHALLEGRLDEMGRLEAAEHLAYCDRCVQRYTDLLESAALEAPAGTLRGPVMKNLWVSVMRSTLGRAAVAAAAAALALGLWTGGLETVVEKAEALPTPSHREERTDYAAQMWDAYEDFMDNWDFTFDFDFIRTDKEE